MSETPHPVDIRVGEALRRERKAAGWSQQRLAEVLGISFQQLQKYERGSNRISASKLFDACRALHVAPSLLFGEAAMVSDDDACAEDTRLAALIHRLPPKSRRTVSGVIEALLVEGEGRAAAEAS